MEAQRSVIGKGNMFQINISDIPIGQIIRDRKGYKIAISDNHLKLKVSIPKFSKTGGISGPCFSLKKQKENDLFRLRIKFPTNVVLRNIQDNLFTIRYFSQSGISVTGSLTITKEEIESSSEKLKIKASEKKRRKSVKQKAKKEKAKRMVEKLERYQSKYKQNTIKDKQDSIRKIELTKKGIYSKDPDATNRCDNCVYFIGSKCTFHNVEVTKNHGCYKFRKYQVLYGGGFSPR